ncbi:MAG: tetratricopeptide repeat protein [Thermodesulfovibrio sp.]|nr:tetratricopeptide repeat protein [Thermodesulfovibrio sp.]MDW7973323.1 tetratricopeptide repeat protein [Thermodesulfovibrio sp.]
MPQIVILHDPLTPQEHLQLGLSYEKKGLIEEAIKHYKEASKSDARGFLFLGNLYLNQEKYEYAEECYKKAIKKDDKLADAYNNLAWLYWMKAKNLEEAERMVKKAIEIERNNPDKIIIYQDTLEKIIRKKLENKKALD